MKLKTMLQRACPLLLACALFLISALPARAADYVIKYPDDFPYEMVASTDGYLFTIDTTDSVYWERYRDSSVRFTYNGSIISGNSQERLLDNISFRFYPFGKDVYVPMTGIIVDADMSFKLSFDANFTGVNEDFTMTLYYALGMVNADGSITTTPFASIASQKYVVGTNDYFWEYSLDPNLANGTTPIRVIYRLDLAGIDDEESEVNIPFTLEQKSSFTFYASSDFGSSIQNSELKDRLDSMIESQDQTNDKLDDIISGSQNQQDAADQFHDQVGDQNNELNDYTDQMDSVDRPDPGDIDVSVDTIVGEFDSSVLNIVVQIIWENEFIHQLMIMSALLMLASYVLYGKKV